MQAVQKLPVRRSSLEPELEMIPLTELFVGAMLSIVSKCQTDKVGKFAGRWVKFTEPLDLRFYNPGSAKDYGKMSYSGSLVFMIKDQLWSLLLGIRTPAGKNKQYECDIVAFKLNPKEISIRHDNAVLQGKIFSILIDPTDQKKPPYEQKNFYHTLMVGDRFGNIKCPSSSKYATSSVQAMIDRALRNIDEKTPRLDASQIQRGIVDHLGYTRESQEPLGALILETLHIFC